MSAVGLGYVPKVDTRSRARHQADPDRDRQSIGAQVLGDADVTTCDALRVRLSLCEGSDAEDR